MPARTLAVAPAAAAAVASLAAAAVGGLGGVATAATGGGEVAGHAWHLPCRRRLLAPDLGHTRRLPALGRLDSLRLQQARVGRAARVVQDYGMRDCER